MKKPAFRNIRPGRWETTEDYTLGGYTVPKGFTTDLDSVPRIPFVYSKFKGRTVAAALIHDYLYKLQPDGITRKEADNKFLDLMILEGVGEFHRTMIHLAVRVGGGPSWASNRRRLEDK